MLRNRKRMFWLDIPEWIHLWRNFEEGPLFSRSNLLFFAAFGLVVLSIPATDFALAYIDYWWPLDFGQSLWTTLPMIRAWLWMGMMCIPFYFLTVALASLVALVIYSLLGEETSVLKGAVILMCSGLGIYLFFIFVITPLWLEPKAREWERNAYLRAEPIVTALELFYRTEGDYPTHLDALTPSYMDKVPTTGKAFEPPFQYERRDDTDAAPSFTLAMRRPAPRFYMPNHIIYVNEGNRELYTGIEEPINLEADSNWHYGSCCPSK